MIISERMTFAGVKTSMTFKLHGFGNPAGGVQTNPKESAISVTLQTFVEQEFDFLLREYLGLSVSLYFHAWCIPDLTLESLAYLLHCCISLRDFLMPWWRTNATN
jgi:hypothetical protein